MTLLTRSPELQLAAKEFSLQAGARAELTNRLPMRGCGLGNPAPTREARREFQPAQLGITLLGLAAK